MMENDKPFGRFKGYTSDGHNIVVETGDQSNEIQGSAIYCPKCEYRQAVIYRPIGGKSHSACFQFAFTCNNCGRQWDLRLKRQVM